MADATDYRARFYATYNSRFKRESANFDPVAANRWGLPYETFFRGWLPASKNARIVDLACGAGRLLFFFKQRGYTDLHGVDVSPEQVAIARQVLSDVREENLFAFLEGSAQEFDLVTALDLIEHLTKEEALRFLDGCYRVLRPGGRLILQTPNADSPMFGNIRYGDFTHENCFTPSSLRSILALSGFTGVEAREIGPVARGVKSVVRVAVWKVLRTGAVLWNLAETGAPGSSVFTRNFAISAVKADH